MISLLEVYIGSEGTVFIADGNKIERSGLVGKRVFKIIVTRFD